VGEPLVIRDWDGRTYRSRVEDVADTVITVALPADLMVTSPYGEGDQLLLTWTVPSGVTVLPIELVASRTERSIRLWDVVPAGEPWNEQRRAHVRVSVAGVVRLSAVTDDADDGAETEDDEAPEPVAGRLVDVSEAALQCVGDAAVDDERLAPGTRVRAAFSVRGEDFDIAGVIHSCRPGERAGQVRLVVIFQHTEREADALRKQVFAAQLEARRSQR
jgi:hypothetical protein